MKEAEKEFSIRSLKQESDFHAFEKLQRETWGSDVAEIVSASLAKIVQKIGGIAAGAFDEKGEMVGLLFGFTGQRDGKPVHWSHMLAVKTGVRNLGVGRELKLFQRQALLQIGVEHVYWTYDPLVAKNAHLNFNLLGAGVTEYVQDMYGLGDDSFLFRGIGTDRFVVEWPIRSDRVKEALDHQYHFDAAPYLESPIVVSGDPLVSLDVATVRLRVEIPADIHQLMASSLGHAAGWRERTRKAFQHFLQRGYNVCGFCRERESGRCFYCLERAV